MIESLNFGESEIALETEKYGGRTIKLPGYTQSNIGDKKTGLTPDEVSQAIMQSLLSRVKSAVKSELKKVAKAEVKEKIDEEKDKLKDKLKEKVGDKVSSEDVDKLKSLFK
jgi:preprotein translocase subunit SecF